MDQIVIDLIEIDDDNTEVLSQQILGIRLDGIHPSRDEDLASTTKVDTNKEAERSSSKRVKREPSIIIIDD